MNERHVSEIVRRVLDEIDARGEGAGRAAAAPIARAVRGAGTSADPGPAPWPPHRVALGSDHGGYAMKTDLIRFLQAKGYAVDDCGTHGPESCDYPDFAAEVARRVADGRSDAGVMIDGAGIGSGMAANKVKGVRCAVCHDVATVRNSREHNDANVLSLGSGVVPMALARRMVQLWLELPHGGGRHWKRVRKIVEMES